MTATAEASAAGESRGCADRYLVLEEARLRYRDEGSGPPVLMVHGWTMDLDSWEPQAAALGGTFRIVRFDRRGFGSSSGRPTLENDARDIGAICDFLELKRIALVAMSQGTRCAVDFAARHPERVACLVLDGPPEFDNAISGANLSLAPFRALVRTQGLAAFHRQWLEHPLMQLHRADAQTRAQIERIVQRYPGKDLMEDAPTSAPADLLPRLGMLTMPVLVITGEFDLPQRVASADALARRLPSAVRAIVAGSGHLSNLDNPAAYNTLIASFIARHTNAASA